MKTKLPEKMRLPEPVIKVLEDIVFFRCPTYAHGKKGAFRESPDKFLVALLIATKERLEKDWISAMLSSTVERGRYDHYLELAQKLLEE